MLELMRLYDTIHSLSLPKSFERAITNKALYYYLPTKNDSCNLSLPKFVDRAAAIAHCYSYFTNKELQLGRRNVDIFVDRGAHSGYMLALISFCWKCSNTTL
ncbi:hypothetical protein J5N97_006452 [Dioscorea zingiberensis]|uniref:Uncharacterized protein n=1 Tax=Dioscorea zingiberensis TaxID=325984 RepID=A0A9D5HTM8_9LILI|nr:hypothetical protein J5N97_006452 [Dioscorea zingiberensis]